MNFALLWLDALLVALLWIAATVAIVSRSRRKWLRIALWPVIVGPPLLVLGSFVYASIIMRVVNHSEPSWFGYSLSLLIAFLIGAILILQAKRRTGAWPVLPPAASLLIAIAVGYMALINMDMAIRARCAILSVKAGQEYWAMAPAIVSESQNAAPLYEKAFARLRADMGADVNNPPTGNNQTFDPNEPATISFLKRQAETIALLREAANRPACRFDSDLQDFSVLNLQNGMSQENLERHSCNVLWLQAKEELAHSNVAPAIANAIAVKRMARQFGQRPMLISALVGLGIDAVGNRMLEEALPKVTERKQIENLHLEELPSMGRMFQQALRGEEMLGLNFYANMPDWQRVQANGKPTNLMRGAIGPAFVRVFFLDPDDYLTLMSDLQNSATQPYYLVRDKLPKTAENASSPFGLLTRIVAPSLIRAFETVAREEAGDGCAEVAVAMTRFRVDHGALPTKLDQLVPDYLHEIPTDPFDGKPLRLAGKQNETIIYSVGPDTIDNGGIEIIKSQGDITFTLAKGP